MLPYQTKYIENMREISALSDFHDVSASGFDDWYKAQLRSRERMAVLRRENIGLLDQNLFPMLDGLYGASAEDIAALEEFAGALMDWTTNLDTGVYVLIHDSLLSLYRVRKDRDNIIRQLYLLGMGLYYQNRMVNGLERVHIRDLRFRNELVFTEAGSYLKFFEEIENEETRGYIIRSLANIGICSVDLKQRIAIGSRVLNIVQDSYYRNLAPGLPWDTFLRRTYQQMSSNRRILSDGGLSPEELATVLDACHEVFGPEDSADNPNIRWLWPYYEMEYTCGFVDLPTTLSRLERLIERTPFGEYDVSGLYGNVQLPIYYGKLMRDNPALLEKPRHVHFLADAYHKMIRTLVTYPADQFTDLTLYYVNLVASEYFETEGVMPYRDIMSLLMQRFGGQLYIRSRKTGDLLRCYCSAIYRSDPRFFDDIEFLRAISDPAEKAAAIAEYADQCGLYHDFGLIKMHLEYLMQSRNLFEGEFRMWQLHTLSGYDDLKWRDSTKVFADVALGHHRWYNGAGGYPDQYVRIDSQYRQMTDVTAVAAFLIEHFDGDADKLIQAVIAQEGTRFSPLVTAFLSDEQLKGEIRAILNAGDEPYYRAAYDGLMGGE